MFTRKPRMRPEEFAITGAKRLLQHNWHLADTQVGFPEFMRECSAGRCILN
jgi:hypothetical protein